MPQALKTIGHSSLVLIEGIRGAVLAVARTKACVSKGASPPLVAANFGFGAVYALGLDLQGVNVVGAVPAAFPARRAIYENSKSPERVSGIP
jgi:hypothetical protein